ncbi:hypothetical protein EJB05_12288, partial [Eragrostis curvula]
MPSMMVQSAAMRRLRRELEISRMRAALAPAGGIAKKPSPPRLLPAPPDSSAPRPPRHARPSLFVISGPRHAAAQADIKDSSISFRMGAQVRVRTPVGTLCTGQRLVLWLGAVVVSVAAEDGYLGVVYTHYKHPGCDRSGAVRVPTKDVKDMLPPPAAAIATATAASAVSSTVTISHSASLPQGEATAVPARRPTTAGKRPSLLKKLEKEMRRKSDAILASCGISFFSMDGTHGNHM